MHGEVLPANRCLPLPMEKYCYAEDFDPKQFKFDLLYPPKYSRGKKKIPVVNEVFAFDIETTGIDEICQSVMYIWQFQIGTELTVFGRTWEEFELFMVKFRNCIPHGAKAICYIFNASYEFSFIKGIYDFKTEEVFAVDRRKILYFQMYGCVEFRCAWLQTNMNLKKFTEKMDVKHKKLDDFDYGIKRYSWSSLTVEEMRYCQNDVLGLCEAIKEEMTRDGDTLITIPYTATGYVRREFKKALSDAGYSYFWAKDFFPDQELYTIMRNAFRGGDTHGNIWYFNRILHNVKSVDRSSSYPDVICNKFFPIKPFEYEEIKDINRIMELVETHNRAFLLRLRFTDVKLKNRYWGDPYLTKDKSQNIKGAEFDNGRILFADSLETCVTDIDYKIISETYDIRKVEVLDCYKSTYGKLPQCMIDLTIEYYKRKTELKGIDPYLYGKAKNKLNSIYGMLCQRTIVLPLIYDSEQKQFLFDESIPVDKMFSDAKKGYWIPYQFGIWVTSWARMELYTGIKTVAMPLKIGKVNKFEEFSDFVYCDTDSVKFIGNADFSAYNEEHKQASLKSGAFAYDRKENIHYMGCFEEETPYVRFKHLGAKRYAGEVMHNGVSELEVTIAGVSKKYGAEELKEKGGLEALQKDFTFYKAGGLSAQYNDTPHITQWEIDGRTIKITSNVYLYPSEYTLGKEYEFIKLLKKPKHEIDICWKSMYNDLCGRDDTATEI